MCNACRQRQMRAGRTKSREAGERTLPPKDVERFLSRVGPPLPSGCREWQKGCFDSGYGAYTEDYVLQGAHRLAYAIEHGEVPPGSWVLHHCDNPPCCEPSHLYLGDNDANVRDRVERQRGRTGERHHAARLTEAQVIEYRRRYAAGESAPALAREAGHSRSMFHSMLTGRLWKDAPGAVRR